MQTYAEFEAETSEWGFEPGEDDEEMPGAKAAEQRYYEAVDQAMDNYGPEEC